MDEQLKGFYDALRSGEAIGVMTSFGGTNGLPNALALYNDEIPLPDPYHLYSISDFNNDFYLSTGLGNGFDQVYVNNSQRQMAEFPISSLHIQNLPKDMP